MPVAAGGEPAEVVRPDDGHAPARPAHPFHLGQARAAVPRRGGEGRAGDDQVDEIIGQRQLVEESGDHPDPVPVAGGRELPPQDPAQRQRGLHRDDVPPALDELHRQPSGARADLGDPVQATRQPAENLGMQPLGAGQPVIELGFEPVQQFPGQDHVGLADHRPPGEKPARLVGGEHAQVGGRVPVPHSRNAPAGAPGCQRPPGTDLAAPARAGASGLVTDLGPVLVGLPDPDRPQQPVGELRLEPLPERLGPGSPRSG